MKKLLCVFLVLIPALAGAQQRATPPITMNDAMGQFWGVEGIVQPDGGVAVVTSPSAALSAAVTQTGGTVTTANTFQTVLGATLLRKGCVIQNTSANVEYISVAASPTEAASRQLAAGAVYNCVSGQQVQITSATAASTFEVESW